MGNLLTANFWFSTMPVPLLPNIFMIFLIVFCAMVAAAIIIAIVFKVKNFDLYLKRLAKKITPFLATMGVIGLIWLFANSQRTPLLSMRFIFILWVIGCGVWMYFIFRYVKKIPELRKELKEKQDFEKYLPK